MNNNELCTDFRSFILSFVSRVKANPELRRKYFHGDVNAFTRTRLLPLEKLTLHMATRDSKDLSNCLIDDFGNGDKRPDKSAWVKALGKIDESYWKDLSDFLLDEITKTTEKKTFNGYEVYAIDSTTLALASYDPKCFQEQMVTHGQVSSYYALHINSAYDVCNDMFVGTVIQKGKELNEHEAAVTLTRKLANGKKQIFLFDRGYPSYNLIAHLIENGQYFLIRSSNTNSLGGSLWEKYSNGKKEGSIHVTVTLTRLYKGTFNGKEGYENYIYAPQSMNFDFLPEKAPLKRGGKYKRGELDKVLNNCSYTLSFRIVRVKIGEEGSDNEYETLITNLSEEEFSDDDCKELYFWRWSEETGFRELKHHEHLLYIHAKRTDFVIAEVHTAIMLHNITAAASLRAVEIGEERKKREEERLGELNLDEDAYNKRRRRLRLLPDGDYALNHSKAAGAIRCFLRNKDETLKDLLKELVRNPVAIESGRSFERKLRPKGFIGFTYRAA